MHSNAIAHRDIKPANILKMESGKYVLVDYGVGVNLAGEGKKGLEKVRKGWAM